MKRRQNYKFGIQLVNKDLEILLKHTTRVQQEFCQFILLTIRNHFKIQIPGQNKLRPTTQIKMLQKSFQEPKVTQNLKERLVKKMAKNQLQNMEWAFQKQVPKWDSMFSKLSQNQLDKQNPKDNKIKLENLFLIKLEQMTNLQHPPSKSVIADQNQLRMMLYILSDNIFLDHFQSKYIFQKLMKNPFKNVNEYAIKVNYNRIRSRTNSKDSVKSHGEGTTNLPTPYKIKHLKVHYQYNTQLKKRENLERESIRLYGAETLRYKPYSSFVPQKLTQENKFIGIAKFEECNMSKIYTNKKRDSDSLSSLVKISSFNQNYANSNDYQSFLNIDSPDNPLQTKAASRDQFFKRPQRKYSFFKSLKEQKPIYEQVGKDTILQNQKQRTSYRSISEGNFSSTNQIVSNRSQRTTKTILKQQQQPIKRKSPEKIQVNGKHFYFSDYYQR